MYAAVPGYMVGGKTGTAQVVGPNGRYLLHTNNASFMAAFPMKDPQYVIYVLVLQPQAGCHHPWLHHRRLYCRADGRADHRADRADAGRCCRRPAISWRRCRPR